MRPSSRRCHQRPGKLLIASPRSSSRSLFAPLGQPRSARRFIAGSRSPAAGRPCASAPRGSRAGSGSASQTCGRNVARRSAVPRGPRRRCPGRSCARRSASSAKRSGARAADSSDTSTTSRVELVRGAAAESADRGTPRAMALSRTSSPRRRARLERADAAAQLAVAQQRDERRAGLGQRRVRERRCGRRVEVERDLRRAMRRARRRGPVARDGACARASGPRRGRRCGSWPSRGFRRRREGERRVADDARRGRPRCRRSCAGRAAPAASPCRRAQSEQAVDRRRAAGLLVVERGREREDRARRCRDRSRARRRSGGSATGRS